MTSISHSAHKGIEPQLRLNSNPALLQVSEDWYQCKPYIEGFTSGRGHVNRPLDALLWRAVLLTDESKFKLLDDCNVDIPSWKNPRNMESPRVSSPDFGNDSKMIVM
ncbi:hypothetical protein TNCV_3670211 [Trichonephila clavipes]|nr:hypothetical protein TNCV_3670211 [Trichonephila clavipes]